MTSGSSTPPDCFPVRASERCLRKNVLVTDELLPDGSMVLYHSSTQRLMTLNPTAALIWECCDGAHDLTAIADEVRDVYPDAINLEQHILTTLETLSKHGMLVHNVQ